MLESIFSVGFVPIVIIVSIILVVMGIASMWKKVPQDEALIVTGLKKRIITGGGGLVIPFLERTDKISLENIQIDVATSKALTSQGVDVNVNGIALLKVRNTEESILSAVEQFNTSSVEGTVKKISTYSMNILEGKLREIISGLTVEQLYQDREKFGGDVREVATKTLLSMGLELKDFTIKDISDPNGYLSALGKKRIAEVTRDAKIAQAEAEKETQIKTAEAKKEGELAVFRADTEIAEGKKEKELKTQSYRKEEEAAKAISDRAYEIQTNISNKEVVQTEVQIEIVNQEKQKELTESTMQVEILKKQRETELAELDIKKNEKILEGTIQKKAEVEKAAAILKAEGEKQSAILKAEADKAKVIAEAEANAREIELEGKAKAEATKLTGLAEADVILAKAKAEAEALELKAQAYEQFGDAAIIDMLAKMMPELAREIAAPLAKTDRITIIDNGSGNAEGGGASKITGYVTDIMTSLPPVMEDLLGVNPMNLISKKKNKGLQLPENFDLEKAMKMFANQGNNVETLKTVEEEK